MGVQVHACGMYVHVNLNWPTLAHCRAEQKAIMMFKIVNHLIDTPGSSLLQLFIVQEATIGYSHNQWQELILNTFIL